jgi:uncharacterized protein YozE (UPF0346 family)
MTLIEFIKSKISENSELGDLAKDIQQDLSFPIAKSENEIISYLAFKTFPKGTDATLKKLVEEYKKQNESKNIKIGHNTNFTLLKTEKWKFYKESFTIDKVFLIGKRVDLYKVYCVDSNKQKALYFDIKSATSLNDIAIIDERKIQITSLTEQVSVKEAIKLLETCKYDNVTKPNEENFNELIDFLKMNNRERESI